MALCDRKAIYLRNRPRNRLHNDCVCYRIKKVKTLYNSYGYDIICSSALFFFRLTDSSWHRLVLCMVLSKEIMIQKMNTYLARPNNHMYAAAEVADR